MEYRGFRWEPDNWWWEKIRFDELGIPESFNIILPDKLMHFLSTFILCCLFYKLFKKNRLVGVLTGWFVMMGPWEIVWDGMFRYGASWKDMVANTLGALVCFWWIGHKEIGQLDKL
jgi:VanZ family protein